MKRGPFGLVLCALCLVSCGRAGAQIPRVSTFYPIGGKAGTSSEVEIRGSALDGANLLLVHGKGVTGTISPGEAKADETHKPAWEAKCGSCHELRSPSNRSMTPEQWAATVERMVKVRSAPLSADEQTKVTQYLVSAARAGHVIAKVQIAPDAEPGLVEVRVGTPKGVSSPRWFEIGRLPEVTGVNGTREQAQQVTLPCVANGCFVSDGERHFFGFSAKKGERLVFNLKAFRYSDETQFFFSPVLRLYDPSGRQIAENHGYYDMDPLIDWTCPADGKYVMEARDMLGRGKPASVYRLTMGAVPYDTVLYPPVVPAGAKTPVRIMGKNSDEKGSTIEVQAPAEPGLMRQSSPYGSQALIVSSYPITRDGDLAGSPPAPSALPAGFTGRIVKAGTSDTFEIKGEGAYEFEGYAFRLGSPIALSVALLKPDGNQAANFNGDGRMAATLEKGKTYKLIVSDGAGRGQPDLVYYVEARPSRPGLEVTLRPDNPTLKPGLTTPVEVIVSRRDGVEGDVAVTAEDLPSGVTATPLVIPPDRDRGLLLLTASTSCAACEKAIRVTATGRGPTGEVKVRVAPQEVYRLSNDPRTRDWSECMLSVRGKPDFTVQFVEAGPIRVDPEKQISFKVKLNRNDGFKAAITVSLAGLPSGWTADPQATEGNEVTLTVRTDGNDTNPFLKRDPKLSPIIATLQASSDEFTFAFGTVKIEHAPLKKTGL